MIMLGLCLSKFIFFKFELFFQKEICENILINKTIKLFYKNNMIYYLK